MNAGPGRQGTDASLSSTAEAEPIEPPRPRWRRLVLPLALLAGAIALGGCNAPSFDAFRGATAQGHDIFKLWSGMMIAGIVVAVIVWGLIFWSVFRYRRRRADEIPRQFHANIPLEIVYTVIPLIIVAGIFYFTVVTENEVDALHQPAEVVHVLAYRWGWRFSYDSGSGQSQHVLVETSGAPTVRPLPATSPSYPQLVLPDHATIEIVLKSEDVIHEFFVPKFDFGRFAQPGITNKWDFTTTTDGTFRGQCAEYCGLYHADMLFTVKVEPMRQFQQWLASHGAGSSSSGALS